MISQTLIVLSKNIRQETKQRVDSKHEENSEDARAAAQTQGLLSLCETHGLRAGDPFRI